MRHIVLLAVTGTALLGSLAPALAISDEECDRRFDAARTTQSLNGMDRQTFGRTQCVDPAGNTLPSGSTTAPVSDAQDPNSVAKDPATKGSPTTPQESRPAVVVPSKP